MQKCLQVVVIAGGTNDWHNIPPEYTLSAWTNLAVGFLQQVRRCLNTNPLHRLIRMPLVDVPLVTVVTVDLLVEVPLVEVPLVEVPLVDVPLVDVLPVVLLVEVPLVDVPLVDVPDEDVPEVEVPDLEVPVLVSILPIYNRGCCLAAYVEIVLDTCLDHISFWIFIVRAYDCLCGFKLCVSSRGVCLRAPL